MRSPWGIYVKDKSDSIDKVIIGLFVSLVLRAALDTAYGHQTNLSVDTNGRLTSFTGAVFRSTTLNVAAFIVTLVRFIFGAYKLGEEAAVRNCGPIKRIWNTFAPMVLFGLFYLTGLWVKWTGLFYAGLLLVHVWDLLWLSVVSGSHGNKLGNEAKNALNSFIALDIVTVLLCSAFVISWTLQGI